MHPNDPANAMFLITLLRALLPMLLMCASLTSQAHHVLGRPAYSLSEDSNTPPAMQIETQIGNYFVTFMAYPAFPQPGEPGRVNFYAARIADGRSFGGPVTFTVRDDGWWGDGKEEPLGRQAPDDGVYRQGYQFHQAGDYLVRASFEADGEPYTVDFPLRIGDAAPIGPIGLTVAVVALLLLGINITQRKRLARLQSQRHRAGKD